MVLNRLVVSGVGKKDAVLKFETGLNVVSGDSDTGKTYAFQCLNYMLGAEKAPKNINEAKDYNSILLEFSVDGELYCLERSIGSNKINVTHRNETITLSCKHDAVSTNNISRYLLSLLLEHDENIILKKNSSNGKRTLSFRDVVHLCTVAETDIIAEASAFQSIQYTEKTARKSVLKYIITGTDDSESIGDDDFENENIRRSGVVQFLEKKQISLKEKIKDIEENKSYKLYSDNSTIPIMIEKIKFQRNLISKYNTEITSNLEQIKLLKKTCFEDEVQISEFEKLRLHYSKELAQNGMISTHADFLSQLPHLECPICNQMFRPGIITSETEGKLFQYFTEVELELQQKINDLNILLNDITDRIKKNRESLQQLEQKNVELSKLISQHQEILKTMSENIEIIRQLDAMNKSLEIYRQELLTVEEDIIFYSEKVKKTSVDPVFQNATQYDNYCDAIQTVLIHWGFSDNISIEFDNATLDLLIDKKQRSSWGKGYRALIMSAMVIGLMRYCCENNRLHPGFVIIDSPLVSLKERKKSTDEKWIDDYMERKMIEDILKVDSSRQVIIFENKDLKYNFDYNYVEFIHDGNDRKGFIP